jgi:signal peptidase II
VWSHAAIFLLIYFSDRIIKALVFDNFVLGVSYPVLENFIYITPTYNTGIAFGLFQGLNNIIFIFISAVILSAILLAIILKKLKSRLLVTGLFLILSGASGNLTDRLLYGQVLDFIDLRIWPVFNIADSAITIGAGMVLFCIFKKEHLR